MFGNILASIALLMPPGDVAPKVTIGGISNPVDIGEMVILTADYDASSLPSNLADLKFNWTILDDGKPKKFFITDGGKEIAFAAGMKPRHIMVILDVNCLYETRAKIKVVNGDPAKPIDTAVITEATMLSPSPIIAEIIVGNPDPPGPAPNPTPNPPQPAPVFPDGQFGLAKFMYDTFAADSSLDQKTKAAIADKLATNLEGVASKIAAVSGYTDIATILADTKKGNDAAFASIPGLDLSKTAALKLNIRTKISQLYNNQKINTASDIATAWKEMAQGLRSIK